MSGLGDTQKEIIRSVTKLVSEASRAALRSPVGELTAPLIDILHTVSKGSEERERETSFCPRSGLDDRRFLTHRYMQTAEADSHADGIAQGELFYESLCAGMRRMERIPISDDGFFDFIDEAIHEIPVCVSTFATALLFDGSRLRRGLEIAINVATDKDGFFGLNNGMAYMLSDGETNTERLRVGASLQFILSAAICGLQELGRKMPSSVLERAEKLKQDVYNALHSCRDNVESKCFVPSRSMRLILDLIAELVEEATVGEDEGTAEFVLRVAFGYPCLVPQGLEELRQYDGGLLSVWDACLHLFELQLHKTGEMLSVVSLLCAVLAGVTGSLMTALACGPFRVHPASDVAKMASEILQTWPRSPSLASTELKKGKLRGKTVNLRAAMRGSMENNFRVGRKATFGSEASSACAYTMLSVNHLLLEGPGIYEGAPSDGTVALKRMYVYSISLELGINTMHAISQISIHTLWRDVLGGALISRGPLCSFTRSGLSSSLHTDWSPSADSSSEDSSTSPIRMLPVVASALVLSKAKKEVQTVTHALMRAVEEDGGSVYILRVCQTMQVLSSIVHTSRSGSLWECLVSRFCTPQGIKRSVLGEERRVSLTVV